MLVDISTFQVNVYPCHSQKCWVAKQAHLLKKAGRGCAINYHKVTSSTHSTGHRNGDFSPGLNFSSGFFV